MTITTEALGAFTLGEHTVRVLRGEHSDAAWLEVTNPGQPDAPAALATMRHMDTVCPQITIFPAHRWAGTDPYLSRVQHQTKRIWDTWRTAQAAEAGRDT